jgi:hypothetical protein
MDQLSESVGQLVEDVVDTARAVADVAAGKIGGIAMDSGRRPTAESAGDKLDDMMDKADAPC